MSNLQPNCCLEFDFRKVDQHAGGKWLIHDTKRRKDNQLQSLKLPCRISKLSSKMWHKGVRWHRIESNILKEGPGTKTSWEVRYCQFKDWENRLSCVSTDTCPSLSTILDQTNPLPGLVLWFHESRFSFRTSSLNKHIGSWNLFGFGSYQTGSYSHHKTYFHRKWIMK